MSHSFALAGLGILLGIAAAVLFGAAGRLDLPAFWVYLAITAGAFIAAVYTVAPDLLQERARPGGKRPPLRLQAVTLIPLAHWLLAGLDRGRWHVGDGVPPALQALGLAAVALAWALMIRAMAVNPFFSSIARLQPDRGQRVVDTGPYAVVRHPGYTAAVLLCVASGPALGSWLSALPVLASLPLVFWRLLGEERMLRTGLPGYDEYARRVRARLVPGLW